MSTQTAGLRRAIADSLELAKLQMWLLSADLRTVLRGLTWPLLSVGVGILLLLGSLPILFIAGSDLLSASFEWNVAVTRLALASTVVVVALLVLKSAIDRLANSFVPISRSFNECAENLECLKAIITRESQNSLQDERSKSEHPAANSLST